MLWRVSSDVLCSTIQPYTKLTGKEDYTFKRFLFFGIRQVGVVDCAYQGICVQRTTFDTGRRVPCPLIHSLYFICFYPFHILTFLTIRLPKKRIKSIMEKIFKWTGVKNVNHRRINESFLFLFF